MSCLKAAVIVVTSVRKPGPEGASARRPISDLIASSRVRHESRCEQHSPSILCCCVAWSPCGVACRCMHSGSLVSWSAGVCILVTLCRGLQVYAFGITMYEMLVHAQPWHGSNSDDIFRKVNAGERPAMPEFLAGVEVRWCQIMKKCWHQDPHQRPDFPTILAQMHELEPQHALMKQATACMDPLAQGAVP